MRYSELISTLQKLINRKPSQKELGNIIGKAQTAISGRAERDSEFSDDEIKLIEQAYNVLIITGSNDKVKVDYYPDVLGSCGTGIFIQSQEKEVIEVPKNAFWTDISLSKHYSMINAYGNSMQPVILDGDKLLIEKYEDEQIIDNRIYVFCYNNEIFIKRLAKNINQLMIMSENEDFDTIKLQKDEMNEVNIIGQVVGLIRNLK